MRLSLGAEELIELGRPVPLVRAPGRPMLIELGRINRAPQPTGRTPYLAARSGGRMSGSGMAAAAGIAAAAYIAAMVWKK